MFYIDAIGDQPKIEVGYNGCHQVFLYGTFDFAEVVSLPDCEPVIEAILTRLEIDASGAMPRIREALAIKKEVDAFFDELKAAHDPAVYDLYRPMFALDELLQHIANYRNRKAAKVAKKTITARRRSDFNQKRDMLVLQLLDAGRPYVCSVSGCGINTELTVDHILAVSRGGSDALDNLQFMCKPHNSEKGDRDPPNSEAEP